MSIVDGNVVEIRDGVDVRTFMQPHQTIEIAGSPFPVRRGVISLTIGALDKNDPALPEADEHGGGWFYNRVPVTVQMFKADGPTAVASFQTQSGWGPAQQTPPTETLDVDAGPANEQSARYTRTNWRIRLTNNSARVADVTYRLSYARDSSLVSESAIPLQLLNNTFRIVLNALSPVAWVKDGELTVRISPEIAEFSERAPEDGQLVTDLMPVVDLQSSQLITLNGGDRGVRMVQGTDVLSDIDARWQQIDEGLRRERAAAVDNLVRVRVEQQMRANNEWRSGWHDKIAPTDVAVRFDIAFADIDVLLRGLWLGEIRFPDASNRLYMVFKSHIASVADKFGRGHAVVLVRSDFVSWDPLTRLLDLFGAIPEVADKIEEKVNEYLPTIHGYLAEALLRLVHDVYVKRLIDCRIVGSNLLVRFCDDPADDGAYPRPGRAPEPSRGDGGRGPRRLPDVDPPGESSGHFAPPPPTQPPTPLGEIPDGFQLGSAESVAALDTVETLVVVMMENRSFDHMLGQLSRVRPTKGYTCYPDGITNTVPGGSALTMIPARDAVPFRHQQIRVDPYHNTAHVATQINGGLMDGFARDITTKPDPADRNPQVPLTYYEEQDIPFFYQLADEFMVCDHWFAAHPGGTYPNRWATLWADAVHAQHLDR